MKTTVDLLITNAAEIITCASGSPKRGQQMAELGRIENGAIAIQYEKIVAVGASSELESQYTADEVIDATGHAICPGFVDCHTHTVYGGNRAYEFEMRIQGATYMEIMAAGGGIVSTMQHTRSQSLDSLVESATKRLDEMLSLGTTTVEIKTGYGLNTETELKLLRVIETLAKFHPCDIVPTFLGAHTVPPEYKDNTEGYVQLVISEMLPEVKKWYQDSHFAKNDIPLFIDVFCEDHAFDTDQSRRILEAGIEHGLIPKIHVDQFNDLGGLPMALELGAMSVDHLDVTQGDNLKLLADSPAIAVPLPAVNFNLAIDYADARSMIDAGSALALATDLNPGSAPCLSMPLVMAIACRYQKLTPAEALTASTLNAAYAVGLGEKVGSIQAGKQADLLILQENDYRHIPYLFGNNPVKTVIKRGQVL